LLTLVPTPIGNIGDITLRAMQALGGADTLLCEDTRVTKKLIMILKERYNLTCKEDQNFISLHSHNEHRFVQNLDPSFFEKNVVYASDAGMPGISDPGAVLVRYCIDHDIEYDVLPGANAVLTAYSASGFNETSFLFFGFLPHKGADREKALQKALYNGYTTILYESPHRLEKLLKELAKEAPTREIFLAKELTKKFQRYMSATAQDLLQKLEGNFKGEWVVVIQAGEAINSNLTQNDILELDIPIKTASKLIAKITGENPKKCYQMLLEL
jgi:16S rRNA (cytidine1402-2'-O)-methyltransferase